MRQETHVLVLEVLWQNNDYYQYSLVDEGTMCGFVIKHTSIDPKICDKHWWVEMRKLVLKTHTDLRSNAIKTMQMKFKGMNQQTEYLIANQDWPTHTGNYNPLNTSRRNGLEHRSSSAFPLRWMWGQNIIPTPNEGQYLLLRQDLGHICTSMYC